MRPPARLAALLAALAFAAPALAAAPAPLHDVLRARRPAAPEYFGLYLLEKKVGYLSTAVEALPGGQLRSDTELVFLANVGGRRSERHHHEVRTYDARPGGKLLRFLFEQTGDGGEQTLRGECLPGKLQVKRARPGEPDETLTFPACAESTEQADPARVALLRRKAVTGTALDFMDLKHWGTASTPGKDELRVVGGVTTRLHTVTTRSDKEQVPVVARVTEDGQVLEINYGSNFVARAEPEDVARRMEASEMFSLTRVTLPAPLPDSAHAVPGQVTLLLSGLPAEFQSPTARQAYAAAPGGKVAVTLRAPEVKKRARLPVADPDKGPNLEATLAVESSAAPIRALAGRLAEGKQDAWAAARAVNHWVYANMKKNYGASSDRATDVLKHLEGDCTEHSLLAVALLRAAGIPARRVDGLLYLLQGDGVPALYWHEWVEAYVGEWVQMDPTFDEEVAHATHLALGYEGDARITPLLGTLKVLEVR